MARSRSLTNMLLDVRMRTNQENSTFVTDAELTEYLNQELAELWTRLVIVQGQPAYRSSTTIAVTAPTAVYALPADFLSVQNVEATIDGLTFALRPYMQSERADLMNSGVVQLYGPYGPLQYRVTGNNIEFRPATRNFSADVFYTPCQPRLSAGSDTFDGFNGFEMCAIAGVCAVVMAKEESDPSFYMGLKQQFYRVAEAAMAQRDMGSPERVQDVRDSGAGEWWRGFR